MSHWDRPVMWEVPCYTQWKTSTFIINIIITLFTSLSMLYITWPISQVIWSILHVTWPISHVTWSISHVTWSISHGTWSMITLILYTLHHIVLYNYYSLISFKSSEVCIHTVKDYTLQANITRWPNAGMMSAHRLRRRYCCFRFTLYQFYRELL